MRRRYYAIWANRQVVSKCPFITIPSGLGFVYRATAAAPKTIAPATTAKVPMLGRPRTACEPAALEDVAAAAPEATDPEAPDAEAPTPEEDEPDRDADPDDDPEAEAEAELAEAIEGRDIEVEATFPTASVDPPDRVEGAEATMKLAVLTPLEMVE
jgi:hypothetical protein